MPLFEIDKQDLKSIESDNFAKEKELQSLIEANLPTVFSCRFVASEFSTGQNHAGRIDTLALSEDKNPVIIEYKKGESSSLVTQSLFYLHWLIDHQGDFEIAARKTLGGQLEIDFSGIRVICLAPNYKKYDLHAVQVMGANIELWTYRLFGNHTLYLEEVFQKSGFSVPATSENGKNPVLVGGKKGAHTRATGSYTVEQHFKGKSEKVQALARQVQEFILNIDPAIAENPRKMYIGYKTSQNIVCMEIHQQKIALYVKLKPDSLGELPPFARDVSEIGHYGTGDLELTIKNDDDLERAKPYIEKAYQQIGA